MKTGTLIKRMKATVDKLNGIIASKNLYLVMNGLSTRRVINAHIKESEIFVTDLYTELSVKVQGNKFVDGYGNDVVI